MQNNDFQNTNIFNFSDASSSLFKALFELQNQGVLHSVDVHFAQFIASELPADFNQDECNLITLFAAKLSNQLIKQNTCINLNEFSPTYAFSIPLSVSFPDISQWHDCLMRSGLLDNEHSPFTLFEDLLYLTRYYRYERSIADFITHASLQPLWFQQLATSQVDLVLNQLFEVKKDQLDKQRAAVENAITKRFSVISGGPGTGKTTTVVKLLLALLNLHQGQSEHNLKIELVAPTGKAAQRLTESISGSSAKIPLAKQFIEHIPEQASTVHRLLKPRGLTSFAHDKNNPLVLDVLVLDEASMVDISLMSKLLSALPEHAQVILLGDKQQLASVEAGNVLAEICRNPEHEFVAELTKSYRFNDNSDIGQLAGAIKLGNGQKAMSLLQQSSEELTWLKASERHYSQLIEQAIAHYTSIRQRSAQETLEQHIHQVFSQLSSFQILACVRQGDYGVDGLNQQIEKRLKHRLRQNFQTLHYDHRPIMISENAYHLGLYNGDIGIELIDPSSNQLYAYFLTGDGDIKQVHCQRLPQHQTVYAMTVHKSQGSEFEHAALVLPEAGTSLLTREIVYTGLTRAKRQFTLFATEQSIRSSISQQTSRESGLARMLK